MTLNLQRVKPGELIKADLMNQIMDALDSLDARIGATGTGVVISQLIPSDQIQVLQDLRIVGSNFQYSIGGQKVFFDSVPAVTYELGSTDSLLIVQVPDLGVLPSAGKQVTVSVSNLTSSDSRQITVVPLPNPVSGPVKVDPGTPSPNPIAQNAIADFPYTLTSAANLPATVGLTATIGGPSWQNLVQILDGNKNLIPDGKIQLVPNIPTNIFVRINTVPNNTNNTAFSLTLSVNSGAVTGSSGMISYTVGQASGQDTTIHMQLTSPQIAGGVLSVKAGKSQPVVFQLTVDNSDTYTISVSGVGNTTNWQFALNIPTPDQNSTTQRTMTINTTDVLNLNFGVFAAATGAASGGQVQFEVQRKGSQLSRTQTYTLQPS
jgi:hypothetical protein